MLLQHFVLSYSRYDTDLVERLRIDLDNAGIPVWKDDRNIEPGTPNFDKAIRQALREAYAVLLLASPRIPNSNFVPDEISVANQYERHVIPVWIDGENYIACIPLGMGKYQYIDARRESYRHGLAQLIDRAKQLVDEQTPKHQVVPKLYRNHITVPNHLLTILPHTPFSPTRDILPDFGADGIADIQDDDAIVINPKAYLTLKALLDDLYMHYLRERFSPLTYGKDWLLQRHLRAYPQLAVPWSWFVAEGCKAITFEWAERVSLQECGLEAGDSWEIAELEKTDKRGTVIKSETICVLCRDKAIIDAVISDDLGKEIYYQLQAKKSLAWVELDAVSPQDFPHLAIIKAPNLLKTQRIRVLRQT
jgi:hypothetical protein